MDLKLLSLKKLKLHNSMSEETLCFEAELYYDGELLCRVENTGKGGCHSYQARTKELNHKVLDLQQHCMTLPKRPMKCGDHAFEADMDLDMAVDDLIHLEDVKLSTKKALKAKYLYVLPDGKMYASTKKKAALDEPAFKAALLRKHPGAKFVNDLPFEEANDLYYKHAWEQHEG